MKVSRSAPADGGPAGRHLVRSVPCPAGSGTVSPEWQWPFRAERLIERSGWALAFGGALLALLAVASHDRVKLNRRWVAAAILVLATGLGIGLQLGLLRVQSERSPVITLIGRTYSAASTSYVTVATSDSARSVSQLLENHAARLGRLPTHARTHPPGPILYLRGAVEICRQVPALRERLVEIAFDAGFKRHKAKRRFERVHLASALLGSGGLVFAAVAAC